MSRINAEQYAGYVLKRLINENYPSQQAFADDFGAELRTVSRYVTKGITKLVTLQQLAEFFHLDLREFVPSTKGEL